MQTIQIWTRLDVDGVVAVSNATLVQADGTLQETPLEAAIWEEVLYNGVSILDDLRNGVVQIVLDDIVYLVDTSGNIVPAETDPATPEYYSARHGVVSLDDFKRIPSRQPCSTVAQVAASDGENVLYEPYPEPSGDFMTQWLLGLEGGVFDSSTAGQVGQASMMLPAWAVAGEGFSGSSLGELLLPTWAADGELAPATAGILELPVWHVDAFTGVMGDLPLPVWDVQGEIREVGEVECGTDELQSAEALSRLVQTDWSHIVVLADSITQSVDPNLIAYDLLEWVSQHIAYQTEWELYGREEWASCAMTTVAMGAGDCEDGAFLLHALLLAKGIRPDDVRTCFGVALDAQAQPANHVWTVYRRPNDGEWVILEWTSGFSAITYPLPSFLPRMRDKGDVYQYIYWYFSAGTVVHVNEAATTAFDAANGALELPGDWQVSGMAVAYMQGELELPKWGIVAGSGAMGALELPGFIVEGVLQEDVRLQGTISLPTWCLYAATGSVGTLELPGWSVHGQLLPEATGALRLPQWRCSGELVVTVVAEGALRLPVYRMNGVILPHGVGEGLLTLPGYLVAGGIRPHTLGLVSLPEWETDGAILPGVVAEGNLTVPSFHVLATARGEIDATPWRHARWQ